MGSFFCVWIFLGVEEYVNFLHSRTPGIIYEETYHFGVLAYYKPNMLTLQEGKGQRKRLSLNLFQGQAPVV